MIHASTALPPTQGAQTPRTGTPDLSRHAAHSCTPAYSAGPPHPPCRYDPGIRSALSASARLGDLLSAPRLLPMGKATATSRHARAARIRPEGAAGFHDSLCTFRPNEAHRDSDTGFRAFRP